MINKEKYVGIVCHDAGAANIIAHWLCNRKNINKYKIYVKGPAKSIFEKKFNKKLFVNNLDELFKNIEKIITGTGWQTDFEYKAIKKAKEKKIFSIAVIDHWINYKERFIFNDSKVWPNKFWVSDKHAYLKAKKIFPLNKIDLKRNYYLPNEVKKVLATNKSKVMPKVLYILEPIRDNWGRNINGEFQALDYFIKNIFVLNLPEKFLLCLRPHPSEKENKYKKWINKYKYKYNIKIETKKSLHRAIGEAEWVVGCQSYALVISLKSGKRTFCSLPPWAPKSILPFDNLVHIKNIVN